MNLTAQVLEKLPTRTVFNRVKCLLFLSPLLLASCQFRFNANAWDSESQAQLYIKTLAKGQEAYYRANGKFANSADKLSINVNVDTPEYKYSIVSEGDRAQRVIMTAAAKVEDLPSYAGILRVNATENEVDATVNMCKTESPSTIPPRFPDRVIPGGELNCPPGSVPVQ
ncbi:type IV pilin-like G/H family protein [Lusitaniella coriacea LEGE 07157]|uniref:Type IV pilin-like G/H family protein n=1 Tax=Lusitaniella coriacea LEGE 07157 TaxID=945747 RepID=A0A8J7B830_9CYAN|nr:type IV pilin-like G/H family protein [Lusitaniella coriacea]MBE9114985.1 type IV pilin-like G/H family protein [Lusitaniella coriacea LEGE 07157]